MVNSNSQYFNIIQNAFAERLSGMIRSLPEGIDVFSKNNDLDVARIHLFLSREVDLDVSEFCRLCASLDVSHEYKGGGEIDDGFEFTVGGYKTLMPKSYNDLQELYFYYFGVSQKSYLYEIKVKGAVDKKFAILIYKKEYQSEVVFIKDRSWLTVLQRQYYLMKFKPLIYVSPLTYQKVLRHIKNILDEPKNRESLDFDLFYDMNRVFDDEPLLV